MRERLLERFTPVLTGPTTERFAALLDRVTDFEEGEGELRLALPNEDGHVLRIFDPGPVDAGTDPRMLPFLERSSGWLWGEAGSVSQLYLHDGSGGTLDALGPDVLPRTMQYEPSMCAPIDLGLRAIYLFDPRGDALWFVDGSAVSIADTSDPVEIYLRELAYAISDGPGTPHRASWLRPR